MLNEKIQIISIIDSSGSMGSVTESVITAYNGFVAEQKLWEGEVDLTLVLFNTAVNYVYKKTPIRDIVDLDENSYCPSGMTAMYDGIGQALNDLKDCKNVIMLIQTDGEENSSKKFAKSDINGLIEGKIKAGWDITFLGANIDAVKVGTSLGVPEAKCIRYNNNAKGLDQIFATMNTASVAYRDSKLNEGTE